MKTHVIVQSLGICLLLVWTSLGEVPVTDAGPPRIHLATSQETLPTDSLEAGRHPGTKPTLPHKFDRPTTQFIPTELRPQATQLIPTEVDSADVFATQLPVLSTLSRFATDTPTAQRIDGFLVSHLLSGPAPVNGITHTATPWREWTYQPHSSRPIRQPILTGNGLTSPKMSIVPGNLTNGTSANPGR